MNEIRPPEVLDETILLKELSVTDSDPLVMEMRGFEEMALVVVDVIVIPSSMTSGVEVEPGIIDDVAEMNLTELSEVVNVILIDLKVNAPLEIVKRSPVTLVLYSKLALYCSSSLLQERIVTTLLLLTVTPE